MTQTDSSNSLRYASDLAPEATKPQEHRMQLSSPNCSLPPEQRGTEALRIAQEAFAKTGSWVVFYREIMGVDGIVRQLFPGTEQMRKFEQTKEFGELQEMVAAVRSQDTSKGDSAEPERMITIRLPKSLHDTLRKESDEMNLSINKLCISKLLQQIDPRCVPVQQGRRRGRRPGPQGPRKKVDSSEATATLTQVRVPGPTSPSSLDG
ncbi:MAG: hypothetical protein WBD20_08070 [Pirellulaceae bacterium]